METRTFEDYYPPKIGALLASTLIFWEGTLNACLDCDEGGLDSSGLLKGHQRQVTEAIHAGHRFDQLSVQRWKTLGFGLQRWAPDAHATFSLESTPEKLCLSTLVPIAISYENSRTLFERYQALPRWKPHEIRFGAKREQRHARATPANCPSRDTEGLAQFGLTFGPRKDLVLRREAVQLGAD